MAINAKQLLQSVIVPTLDYIGLNSPSAQNLMLGTCAQESQMGTYLKQVGGPALGIYQIEPVTHKDIVDRLLFPMKQLHNKVLSLCAEKEMYTDRNIELISNLRYATAVARCVYLKTDEPLPDANDIAGLARYWKANYNTANGKGEEQDFIDNYKRYVVL